MGNKPNFYTDWINWAVRKLEDFGKQGDWPSVELFARDLVRLISPYMDSLPLKYLFDPLKPLREGMRAMQKKWKYQ